MRRCVDVLLAKIAPSVWLFASGCMRTALGLDLDVDGFGVDTMRSESAECRLHHNWDVNGMIVFDVKYPC